MAQRKAWRGDVRKKLNALGVFELLANEAFLPEGYYERQPERNKFIIWLMTFDWEAKTPDELRDLYVKEGGLFRRARALLKKMPKH